MGRLLVWDGEDDAEGSSDVGSNFESEEEEEERGEEELEQEDGELDDDDEADVDDDNDDDDDGDGDDDDDDDVGLAKAAAKGMSDVMKGILSTETAQDVDVPILAKDTSTIKEIVEAQIQEKEQQDELKRKRAKVDVTRVAPADFSKGQERRLRKMATKGAVALFNAVRQKQQEMEELESPAAAKKSLSKNAFLEMLGSKAIADPVGGVQVVRGQGADDDDDGEGEGEGEGEGMDGRIRGSSGRYPSGNDFEDVLANDGDEDDDF